MTFVRQPTEKWRVEVPGARWFKADLHIHTIDDRAGSKAKLPSGFSGNLTDEKSLAEYARFFLREAVNNDVRVLGLTPHSPRLDSSLSAVWAIVEQWNTGVDDDGTAFHDKIFAVFPGFEPSFKDGDKGLHLLFLFDPEIGRDRYFRLFDVLMDGVAPWKNKSLQISNKTADEGFRSLAGFIKRECEHDTGGSQSWQHIVLAPHIEAETGLLGAKKAQVLQWFAHDEIRGLEMADHSLVSDTLEKRPWLRTGMNEHNQAFFHSSDSYSPEDIGSRHVWVKMASPRIEALRQAFIASESRMRIGFERTEDGNLSEIVSPPDVTLSQRYWLRSITVSGGASFFGGNKQGRAFTSRFELSPDLTCIIGGSMTGKSTFLDGLRKHLEVDPPRDSVLAAQASERAGQFMAGSPGVELDFPNEPPEISDAGSRLAVFFSQGELQRLAYESGSEREILANLDLDAKPEIEGIESKLHELDEALTAAAAEINHLEGKREEAEQAVQIAREAEQALKVFAKVGVEGLHAIQKCRQDWKYADKEVVQAKKKLNDAIVKLEGLELPSLDGSDRDAFASVGIDADVFRQQPTKLLAALRENLASFNLWLEQILGLQDLLESREKETRTKVEKALADKGYDANKIREFQGLSRQSALLKSYEANFSQIEQRIEDKGRRFKSMISARHDLVHQQRVAFDRVIESIKKDFDGLLRARRFPEGDTGPLQKFLNALNQRGITRWWNTLASNARPSPAALAEALQKDELDSLNMSAQVQNTFKEVMSRQLRRELLAIRCPDRYVIEQRMEGKKNEYRDLERLSGGRQVSVLLSLLLKTNDSRMLVIDQPEDQLDNRFLFNEVLPALKALKGKRQIVLATHNANIVVNGDADQVIQLDATADKGRVSCSGAIEEPDVRHAIVETVDGGREAFRLRKLKYGF